ncbi:hypothetical protein EH243_05670 [Amphritea opalescens]|uniref:Uncharacterized protein n=1 Tax=Amphritea opalescens TaxID=2490544 RepID=A0A430KSW1_9GAMM|nr:hypothetical protein [Amphritea opalescens]RTE66577.1 hypothetical protein EH243_05670 [Amphritea opalescens]
MDALLTGESSSVTYGLRKPVLASAIVHLSATDESAEQRQRCSILTLKADRTRQNIDINERDKACGGER